jgi:hypothetical protein
MSYRDITVGGTAYKYTIGRTHVKVHGMQATLLKNVGKHREYDPQGTPDGFGDTRPFSALFPSLPLPTRWSVTPQDVADFIQNDVEQVVKVAG